MYLFITIVMVLFTVAMIVSMVVGESIMYRLHHGRWPWESLGIPPGSSRGGVPSTRDREIL